MKLASQSLDATDQEDAILVFKTWSREIKLNLACNWNWNWNKTIIGEIILDGDFVNQVKAKFRAIYSWIRLLNNE